MPHICTYDHKWWMLRPDFSCECGSMPIPAVALTLEHSCFHRCPTHCSACLAYGSCVCMCQASVVTCWWVLGYPGLKSTGRGRLLHRRSGANASIESYRCFRHLDVPCSTKSRAKSDFSQQLTPLWFWCRKRQCCGVQAPTILCLGEATCCR